ncbi:Rv3235 family protein [Glutamicibacter sp. 363]|uniref:Rv3235 family protein n=1 Tax=unclassified Glutamicibacter TaxID=2627139 RepID=UPI0011420F36|nr:Rv3235 family protein [Glutamicibacter sp. BW80]
MSIESEILVSRTRNTRAGICPNTPLRFTADHRQLSANRSPQQISLAMDRIFHRPAIAPSERKTVIELSHAVSRAVFEIIAGYRSVSQLTFVMDPECVKKLRSQAILQTGGYTVQPMPGTSHGEVRSLHLWPTISGAYECSVIVAFKHRVRAVALRIEPWHGRWQITSVEML